MSQSVRLAHDEHFHDIDFASPKGAKSAIVSAASDEFIELIFQSHANFD